MIPFLKKHLAPNRVAVYLTAIAAIAGGLAPVVAELDLSSTVGVLGGLAAIVGVVNKWLQGWQQYEAANYRLDIANQEAEMQKSVIAAQAQAAGGRRKSPILH